MMSCTTFSRVTNTHAYTYAIEVMARALAVEHAGGGVVEEARGKVGDAEHLESGLLVLHIHEHSETDVLSVLRGCGGLDLATQTALAMPTTTSNTTEIQQETTIHGSTFHVQPQDK